jgi:hypothetical protein
MVRCCQALFWAIRSNASEENRPAVFRSRHPENDEGRGGLRERGRTRESTEAIGRYGISNLTKRKSVLCPSEAGDKAGEAFETNFQGSVNSCEWRIDIRGSSQSKYSTSGKLWHRYVLPTRRTPDNQTMVLCFHAFSISCRQ